MSLVWTNGSIPLFLAKGRGKIAPQVKFFDVTYSKEPLVGFHVMGVPEDTIAGFFVSEDLGDLSFLTVFSPDDDPNC